jgi:excisionase family DNA binding protein
MTAKVDDPPRTKAAQMRAVRAKHAEQRATGRLLALPAAADYLGLPYTTLRSAVARGLLPAVRIPGGRGLWIERRALDKALEAWTEQPGAKPL